MKHANISLFVPHAGCRHMCSFCNQKTISGKINELTPGEVTATLTKASKDGLNPENTEIAFFGGSFTAIEKGYMISLLEAAYPFIESKMFSGIRISTRPDAIDDEILKILSHYGVTSIELGAQSTDDEVLFMNHRGHLKEDIFNASGLIKKAGFSLGLQMMTGLYGDSDEKSLKTCDDIISLSPDTVRIYPTIVLENTELAALLKSGEYKPQTLEQAVFLCSKLLKKFYDNDITVIRLGLHSGGNVEEGYIAGPYHPAFGELCESKIYIDEAKKALNKKFGEARDNLCSLSKKQKITIFVNDREISKMTGQRGANKATLLLDGFEPTIKGNSSLKKYEVVIE